MIVINSQYEKIFTENPVGPDGDIIDTYISMEADKICNLLSEGQQMEAATLAMQLIKSLCRHFIEDEHWCYFDDMYSPDYTIIDLLSHFKQVYEEGKLNEEVVEYLHAAWKEIDKEESRVEYGYPIAKLEF
jgi:ribosomal protein S1